MTSEIDYAAIRAVVDAAKRQGLATADGSSPEPTKKATLPEPINPDLPDWLLKEHARNAGSFPRVEAPLAHQLFFAQPLDLFFQFP